MEVQLIPATKVRNALGGISDMSLWRWLDDESLNFPKPIKIQGRRYWKETDIVEWLEVQAGEAA